MAPPKSWVLNSTHIRGTPVPVEEPSTALRHARYRAADEAGCGTLRRMGSAILAGQRSLADLADRALASGLDPQP
jgi:hypothetical protein